MLINYLLDIDPNNSNPYLFEDYDAPGLDPEMPWDDLDESMLTYPQYEETDYLGPDTLKAGDIVSADVFQDRTEYVNLDHLGRPFLIISVSYSRVFGLQLSSKPARSLADGAVPLDDFKSMGLKRFGYIMTNMERGVDYKYINYKIGHISPETKDRLLAKLKEIKANKNDAYSEYPILDRIDSVLEKVHRIIV